MRSGAAVLIDSSFPDRGRGHPDRSFKFEPYAFDRTPEFEFEKQRYEALMDEPRWLNEQAMAAWRGFVAASNLVARRLERQLKEDAGLSHTQYEILVQLSASPSGSLRMTDLADRLITSKSGLTYQVTQLERAGLVGRRSCPSDVR